MNKEKEYRDIFLAEAEANHEELNKLLTKLEKKSDDVNSINAIFRITHTLKGNAAGMGYEKIAEFSHLLEDLFSHIREGKIELNDELFTTLFKSLDSLEKLIDGLKSNKKVNVLGTKTKLKVLLKGVSKIDKAEEAIPSKTKKPVKKKKTTKDKAVTTRGSSVVNSLVSSDSTEVSPSSEEDKQDDSPNQITFSDLVQVPVKKLDNLLNLVGELIIEKDRLVASHTKLNASNEYSRLNRISSDLQYSVMDVRLIQVGFLFNKFHRVVRDVANSEKKKVDLVLEGTETEIDRNILQIISDSLIHLIRNAIGHGIETPEERKKKGKVEIGQVKLNAFAEKDVVFIEIEDDGKGIDVDRVKKRAFEKGLIGKKDLEEISDQDASLLIFEPGFSTMEQVTSISGRGVGMDVVKKALESVGGTIAIDSQNAAGTKVSLRLPSSMAVKGTLLFEIDMDQYAIPLSYTECVVSFYKSDLHYVGQRLAAVYSDETILIVFLKDHFNETNFDEATKSETYGALDQEDKLDVIIVNHNGRKIGFVVDKLFQQKEIVEKPLSKPVDNTALFSGVTIMGNGKACLVINVIGICNLLFGRSLANQTNHNL